MITVVDSPHFFDLYSSKNDVGKDVVNPFTAPCPASLLRVWAHVLILHPVPRA